jgi:hypothetical protein
MKLLPLLLSALTSASAFTSKHAPVHSVRSSPTTALQMSEDAKVDDSKVCLITGASRGKSRPETNHSNATQGMYGLRYTTDIRHTHWMCSHLQALANALH